MKAIYKEAFTLIELLIVIAIIGILVVGILVALDPVEQTRRATDSNTLSTADEVRGAIKRYQVSRGCWPWETNTAGVCSLTSGCVEGTSYVLGAAGCGTTITTALTEAGDLKSFSGSLISVVPNNGVATAWKVVFEPVSKSLGLNTVQKYTTTACSTSAALPCAAVGSACNYCINQ